MVFSILIIMIAVNYELKYFLKALCCIARKALNRTMIELKYETRDDIDYLILLLIEQ